MKLIARCDCGENFVVLAPAMAALLVFHLEKGKTTTMKAREAECPICNASVPVVEEEE